MKTLLHIKNLPRQTLVLGVMGMVLQALLFTFAVDEKGLLTAHPLGFALAAVTLAAIALIAAGVFRWNREPLTPVWRSSSWSAVTLLATLGFGSVLFGGGFGDSRLVLVRSILSIASILAMIGLFVLDRRGKAPHFLLYAIVCIFFGVHLVSCYQLWSSDPQIMDYLFTLLANVGLMLYFYQKAAALVGFRKERTLLAIGLLAAFFCYVSVWGEGTSALHLCCGCWVLTDVRKEFSGE